MTIWIRCFLRVRTVYKPQILQLSQKAFLMFILPKRKLRLQEMKPAPVHSSTGSMGLPKIPTLDYGSPDVYSFYCFERKGALPFNLAENRQWVTHHFSQNVCTLGDKPYIPLGCRKAATGTGHATEDRARHLNFQPVWSAPIQQGSSTANVELACVLCRITTVSMRKP